MLKLFFWTGRWRWCWKVPKSFQVRSYSNFAILGGRQAACPCWRRLDCHFCGIVRLHRSVEARITAVAFCICKCLGCEGLSHGCAMQSLRSFWRVTWGGKLAQNAGFGNFPHDLWRKPHSKHLFWRVPNWSQLLFGGFARRSGVFGAFACHHPWWRGAFFVSSEGVVQKCPRSYIAITRVFSVAQEWYQARQECRARELQSRVLQQCYRKWDVDL